MFFYCYLCYLCVYSQKRLNFTNDRINDRLTKSEQLVLNYILENKIISNVSMLTEKLNKSTIIIQINLKKLVELNLIERIGSNKTGYQSIKK